MNEYSTDELVRFGDTLSLIMIIDKIRTPDGIRMNETEREIRLRIDKEKNLLLRMLSAYCAGVSLCRLTGPILRQIAFLDWALYQKYLISRLPYYLIPIIALTWLTLSRYSRSALFFTLWMGLIGIVNHGLAAFRFFRLPILFFRFGREASLNISAVAALILAVVFAGVSFFIFWFSKRLLKNHESKIKYLLKAGLALILLLLFHISPFYVDNEYSKFAAERKIVRFPEGAYRPVTLLHADSNIQYMAGSPDGKLLAIGTEKSLSVWDAETRECIWSDASLRKVRRIRFSQSGKYLAAGGRGVPEGSSDIAVYEVEGFKRLPGVELPEEDLTKEKLFHDFAFRPDENSLLVAWHKNWDWEQMPGGYRGEEAKAIRKSETTIMPEYIELAKKDLVCTELSLEEQGKNFSKTIKNLSTQYDLPLLGGIHFSPSASYLIYPNHYLIRSTVERNRLYLMDTRKWSEEEIMLSDRYSIFVGVGTSDWYELEFSRDEKEVYFLCKGGTDIANTGKISPGHMLVKLNLETKKTEEIFKIPHRREMRTNSAWGRITLSPDGEEIALLVVTEIDYYERSGKQVILRIIDLKTEESRLIAYPHTGESEFGRNFVWLSEMTAAVFLREDINEFFFGDIGKENE